MTHSLSPYRCGGLWFVVKVARCADRSYQLFELNLVIVGDGMRFSSETA
jgi:hypothetical protein